MTTATASKRRRAKGQGSVYRRPEDGRWVAKAWTGEGGCRRRVVLYGKTRLEVEDKLTRARSDAAAGRTATSANRTIGHQLTAWLELQQGRDLRPRTLDSYAYGASLVAADPISRVKLAAHSADDVESMQSRLRAGGLSPNTVSLARMVLGSALKRAERTYRIPNQVRNAEPVRVEAVEPRLLSPEQAAAVIDAADGSLARMVLVAVHTGLRISELLALRDAPESVDFGVGIVRVGRQLQRVKGAYGLAEIKTAAGRREIPLSPSAVAALKAEMAQRDSARALAGDRWAEPIPGLVFETSTGKPRNRQAITHSLNRALANAGLEPMHFHHLRHAFAGLLDLGGAELNTISKLLGHQNVAITAKVYTGVLRERKAQAIAGLPAFGVPRLGGQR